MNYLYNFEAFNESKLKNLAAGGLLLTSLLGNPNATAKSGEDEEPMEMVSRKSKAELSIIDKADYTALVTDLEKKNYSIYGYKPEFDSHRFLFSTCTSPKFKYAMNTALKESEAKLNTLDEEKGLQVIYYIHLQNTWQVIIITELVSEEEEGRLYDRETGTFRGL